MVELQLRAFLTSVCDAVSQVQVPAALLSVKDTE